MSGANAPDDADVVNQRILAEQVALMCRLTTIPLFGSIFVGAIIAYVAIEGSGLEASLLWYAASLLIMIVRWRLAHEFLQRAHTHKEVLRWRMVLLGLVAIFGLVWSIPPVFLLPVNPEKEVIMSVMFIGATATGIGSLSPVRHAYAVLLIPFTLPYGVSQMMMGGNRMLIGVAFLLYLPVMITIASRQTTSVERQLRLAIENDTLVNELRLERDRESEINRELEEQVEQQRLAAERISKLNQDLELRAAELRAANDDLEGFSYSVSHDLRGPLRAIDGFSSLLDSLKTGDDSHNSEHYVHRIRENIARMSTLIDGLLAFSRCGRQALQTIELRMDQLVRDAIAEVQPAYATALSFITVESLPPSRGDRILLLQVWVNLIDNAVKYSAKVGEPSVTISGRLEADQVVYEVIDNGAGFDSGYADRLFEVFQRLHGPHEYPGAGVGLAIVHRIVTRHGGKVWAQSKVNQGATFSFSMPSTRREAQESLQRS